MVISLDDGFDLGKVLNIMPEYTSRTTFIPWKLLAVKKKHPCARVGQTLGRDGSRGPGAG